MNMNLLAVLTPPSIYHGCSIQYKFWEKTFTPVNMENFGSRNVGKQRDINNGEKYITL